MLKHHFAFNNDVYNFWPIYEAIRKYYPIGIKKLERINSYYEFQGTKEKEKLLVEQIHDQEAYQKNWGSYCSYLSKELGQKVTSTTMGQAPCLGAEVELLDQTNNHIKHIRTLHFTVSLLGPFYQIYGVDKTIVMDPNSRRSLAGFVVNWICPSPKVFFEEIFLQVEKHLKVKYPNHRFVPFFVSQAYMNGLQVRYNDESTSTIGEALFDDFLRQHEYAPVDKNTKYGTEQWVREGVDWPGGGFIY